MNQPNLQPATFAWRGIHHIALATHDIEATVAFYRDIVGVQGSAIYPSRDGRGRHAILLTNPTEPKTLGLHFFERANMLLPAQPVTLATAAMNGNLLHFALYLDATDQEHLRNRLQSYSIAITEIPELASFVFADNNGLLIEVITS